MCTLTLSRVQATDSSYSCCSFVVASAARSVQRVVVEGLFYTLRGRSEVYRQETMPPGRGEVPMIP